MAKKARMVSKPKKTKNMKALANLTYFLLEGIRWNKYSFFIICIGSLAAIIGAVHEQSWSLIPFIAGNIIIGLWYLKTIIETLIGNFLGKIFGVKNYVETTTKVFLIAYPLTMLFIIALAIIGIQFLWVSAIFWIILSASAIITA